MKFGEKNIARAHRTWKSRITSKDRVDSGLFINGISLIGDSSYTGFSSCRFALPNKFEGIHDEFVFFCLQLIACGIAVATYNEGATDFKDTPAYKESIQSRELLEEPEASGSDVFESNPTEEAPSLE